MNLRILVILLLAPALTFAQVGRGKKVPKSPLKVAKDHLRYEEYGKAIPSVKELLSKDANNPYYNYWMGKCLFNIYKKNQALPYFERVEKINPRVDQEFYYWYGLALHYNLHFDRALEAYRKDLERYEPGSPEYIWVNNRISQCLYAKKLSKQADAEQVRIDNMGRKINTEYAEHSPVISANDSVLLFTARRPDCLGAKPEIEYYDEDVYITHKVDGQWEEATNIGKPVNSNGHDATISLTADGKTLYIYRHKKAGGLFMTKFDEEGKKWREPRIVEHPLNSKYYEASICLSADSTVQFFTSDRPGGFGGRDIYMVKKEGRKWGDPINLGSGINTPFDEDAPYFHPDGVTLYYSSNGPESMGGFDIFVTQTDTSVEGSWLTPLNMGTPINTPDDDIYFVLSQSGRDGYYSSGMEGGYGEKDIYHIRFPYYPYPRRFHIVEITGLIQDSQTLDTLKAMVKLVDAETQIVLDSVMTGTDSSRYYFMLEPQRAYSLVVSAEGYFSSTESVETPLLTDEDLTLKKNMKLSKPEPEAKKMADEIQNIYYDFDSYSIRPDAAEELNKVIKLMAQDPSLKLVLSAHTDWFGNYDYNVALSDRRAKSARAYLIQNGIDPGRVSIDHFSENRPLDSNDNDTGRQFNRRTELRLIKDNEVVASSKKLRTGITTIPVDHTKPKGKPGFDNPKGLNFDLIPSGEGEGGAKVDDTKNATSASETIVHLNPTGTSNKENAAGDAPAINEDSALATDLSTLEFTNIYFDYGKSSLSPSSKQQLDIMAEFLSKHPDVSMDIAGHADASGSVEYNQTLSENRAKAAYNYLRNKGITNITLAAEELNEKDPADDNSNAAGRQNDRRVEFRLLRNAKVIARSGPRLRI